MLSTQKGFNQNSFDEGLPCDNLKVARLSSFRIVDIYVDIFQDS